MLFALIGGEASPGQFLRWCWSHCRSVMFGKVSPTIGMAKSGTPKPYLIADFSIEARFSAVKVKQDNCEVIYCSDTLNLLCNGLYLIVCFKKRNVKFSY